MKELVAPVDGGTDVVAVTSALAARHRAEPVRIHLLNVQRPLPMHITQFFGSGDLTGFHREAGLRVLDRAAQLLDQSGIPHEDHVVVGRPAECIVQFAEAHDGAEVVLPEEPAGMLALFGLGSIASQVRRLMLAHAAPAVPDA